MTMAIILPGIPEILIILLAYILLPLTSGYLVYNVLSAISKKPLEIEKGARDTGFIIGKCENLLILTLMLLDAYTALAIIFTGKTIVRREDMSRNSLYYLAGTMVNVTYSVVVGATVKALLALVS